MSVYHCFSRSHGANLFSTVELPPEENSSSSGQATAKRTEMPHNIPMTRRDFIRAHAILGGRSWVAQPFGASGWRLAEVYVPCADHFEMHFACPSR